MSGDAGSLKRSIEGWREIVILTDSVLSWEKVCLILGLASRPTHTIGLNGVINDS